MDGFMDSMKLKEKSKPNYFFKLILWLIGIGVVCALVMLIGWEQIQDALRLVDISTLMLLISLQVLTLLLSVGQMWYVLGCGGIRLSFFKVFSIYMAGNFIESVTPSIKFGGEAVKIFLLKRETGLAAAKLTGTILTFKVISMLPFALIFMVSAIIIYFKTAINLLPMAVGIFAILLFAGVWLFGRSKKEKARGKTKVGRFIQNTLLHMENLLTKGQFIVLLAVSTFIWLLYPIKFAIVAQSLDIHLPFPILAAILFSGYMVSMLPLLPGGLGSFEGSIVLLLGFAAVQPQAALAIILTLRLATYWLPLLPGGIFCALEFAQRDHNKRYHTEADKAI